MKKLPTLISVTLIASNMAAQAVWTPNGTSYLYNNPFTSNVGIGMLPTEKLHVNGNIKCDNGTLMYGLNHTRTENLNDASASVRSGFFETSNPTNYPQPGANWWHLLNVRHSNPGNNYAMQFAGGFYDQDLYFRKTANYAGTGWSKVIMANSIGLVGINNSNPSAYLHITTPNNSTSGFVLEHSYTSAYSYAQLIKVNHDQTKAFDIVRKNGSTETELFQVWGDGKTHIGEKPTNPWGPHANALLSVYGKVVAKSLYISIANGVWADYVFENDYKLPSLQALEKYAKENKHLPGVMTAKEVEENGVNVVEVNVQLLKKLEEAYLHIFELNKRIEVLENKNK